MGFNSGFKGLMSVLNLCERDHSLTRAVSTVIEFSVRQDVEIGSGVHSAFFSVGIRPSFPGVKQPGHEAKL